MKKVDLAKLNQLLKPFLASKIPSNRKLVLVRSAESQGNLSGTITGWMDVRLSDFGRKQSFLLNQVFEENQSHFSSVHSSDLQRCRDTAFYAMGFPSDDDTLIKQSKSLREMHFGAQEGLHYDNLSQEEKAKLSDPNYQAPNGENWPQVRTRATDYFRNLGTGNHLVFTHGGLITSYLYSSGLQTMPNNCSFVGVYLKDQGDLGEFKEVSFVWEFPYIEEDI